MSRPGLVSAQEAFKAADDLNLKIPVGRHATFVCPFPNCRAVAQHHWGVAENLMVVLGENSQAARKYSGRYLSCALCEACKQEILFLDGEMIWPVESDAAPPSADLPPDLLSDYEEASAIYRSSPRGAAALLRLLIQKLCVELGSTKKDINSAIGEFVSQGRISPAIQKALDAVRVIGNEAVHPGAMDLKDDAATVNSLFGLINFIVEKMISEPKEIDAIYSSLPPGKLAGIADRDS